jgi:hypothetical protein
MNDTAYLQTHYILCGLCNQVSSKHKEARWCKLVLLTDYIPPEAFHCEAAIMNHVRRLLPDFQSVLGKFCTDERRRQEAEHTRADKKYPGQNQM